VWENLIAVEAFDGSQCIVSGLIGEEALARVHRHSTADPSRAQGPIVRLIMSRDFPHPEPKLLRWCPGNRKAQMKASNALMEVEYVV